MERGGLFEQWVILQVMTFMRAHKKEWRLSSYRTDAGAEVDLILDIGSSLWAIECKWGKNVTESETGGLRSFEEVAHKPVKKFILFTGESPQRFSRGETAVPYQQFFRTLLPSA